MGKRSYKTGPKISALTGQMPASFGLRAPRFGVAYLIAAAATLAGRVALARRSCVPGARLLCEVNGVSVCDQA